MGWDKLLVEKDNCEICELPPPSNSPEELETCFIQRPDLAAIYTTAISTIPQLYWGRWEMWLFSNQSPTGKELDVG